MERLPSMTTLRMFEATAKLQSVRKAAQALYVTPAAVSKQVQALEAFLGVELFARTHRRLALTRDGEDYLKEIEPALNSIRQATRRIGRREDKVTVNVRAYTTFAMYWLIPRLSAFHDANPDINIALSTSLAWIDFDREDVDVAIRLGSGDWPGLRAIPLVENILKPVCSPAVAQSLHGLDDLRRTTLLHTVARPDDWQRWLSAQGVTTLDGCRHRHYESSALVYQAAIQGQGVGMAQQALVGSLIDDGSLVFPLAYELDLKDYTYYLVAPENRRISRELATFRDWLQSSAETR